MIELFIEWRGLAEYQAPLTDFGSNLALKTESGFDEQGKYFVGKSPPFDK